MNKKQFAAKTLVQFGGVPAMDTFWGKNRLTVMAYHRIMEHENPDFADLRSVVSATPTVFEQQLDFVSEHFNVISLADLRAAMRGEAELPLKPLLITFDDGYLDNYEHAVPALKRFGFPAVIFLATSRMTDPSPLWWDALARCFHHTTRTEAELPLVGKRSLEDREAVLDTLSRAMKTVPEGQKLAAVEEVRAALDVTDLDDHPLFMNWDQVREVLADGIVTQPHTVTHPILTRVDVDEQRRQINGSRDAIIAETGQEVYAFAYPNGTPEDYNEDTMRLLNEAGIEMAFTLTPGPMRWDAAKAHPLQIRRVYLGHHDTEEVFKAKVMGFPALRETIAYPNSQY